MKYSSSFRVANKCFTNSALVVLWYYILKFFNHSIGINYNYCLLSIYIHNRLRRKSFSSSWLIEITAYSIRKLTFYSRRSLYSKGSSCIITVILIIALHNYQAHQLAICTRLMRSPCLGYPFPIATNRMVEEKSSGLNVINPWTLLSSEETKKRESFFLFVINAMFLFDDS